MKHLLAIFALSLILSIGYTSPLEISNQEYWQKQIGKIKLGMARKEVERILPPIIHDVAFGTGGSQTISYWVDTKWKVVISYDYTGVPRDSSGKALSTDSPSNKIIHIPPLLIRENIPPPISISDIKITTPPK